MYLAATALLPLFLGHALGTAFALEAYGGADQPGECTGQDLGSSGQTCGLAGAIVNFPNAACAIVTTQQGLHCCTGKLCADSNCNTVVGCFDGTEAVGTVIQADFEYIEIACDDPPAC